MSIERADYADMSQIAHRANNQAHGLVSPGRKLGEIFDTKTKAIQDFYPDAFANCFGCGRNNPHGLHTRTYWVDETESGYCTFTPKAHCCGYKAVFHGGLLSSVMECNSVATSIAATFYYNEMDPEKDTVFYVLGEIVGTKLMSPVPIDSVVEVKTKVTKLLPRKAHCHVEVFGNGNLCSTGELVTVRVPDDYIRMAFLNEQMTRK